MDDLTKQVDLSLGACTYCDTGYADQTILLLHGFSFRQGMYPLMNALRTNFRVVVPDLPFSTNLEFSAQHTLENYVSFLLEFVQALDVEKVSVFGNSVGGTLALMCGMQSQDIFDEIIVRCPLWSRKQLPYYLKNRWLVNLHYALSESPLYARSALRLFYHISARISPLGEESVKHPVPYEDGQVAPIVLSRFLAHLVQVELEDKLSAIQNETLIIWGELDSFVESRWGKYLNRILPHSQYIEMTCEYHNIATSDPEALAKHILTFTH